MERECVCTHERVTVPLQQREASLHTFVLTVRPTVGDPVVTNIKHVVLQLMISSENEHCFRM